MIPALNPEVAMRKILLGDFGKTFCDFLNKHQKGNRYLMETLTGQAYPLRAIHPNDLFALTQGETGAKGLTAVLELVQKQQADIIRSFNAALQRGAQAQAAEQSAEPAEPAPAEAEPRDEAALHEEKEARRLADLEQERELANHG